MIWGCYGPPVNPGSDSPGYIGEVFAESTLLLYVVKICMSDHPLKNAARHFYLLEPVCCKKQQKKVPDQLLVCGIGDL